MKAKQPDKWAAIDAMRGMVDDEVPDRAFSIYEYQERYGLCRPTAASQLSRKVMSGKLHRGVKRDPERNNQRVVYYWMPEE